jgi:lysophospholipase L1-like esterase
MKLVQNSAACAAMLAAALPIIASGAPMQTIPAADPHIAVMGRTQQLDNGSLRFSYPGVTLLARVDGRSLAVDASSTGDQSYLDVSVDGGVARTWRLSPGLQHVVLLDAATAGPHQVEIVHRSETWHGIVTVSALSTDGQFAPAPTLPLRKMLVLGDSVTCGEAIDRVAGGKKEPRWWNPRESYGMLAARALGAQVQLVCMGGHGLVRSWNGKKDELNLPDYYRLAIPELAHPVEWDQSRYQPDLIVGAIGTNDFNLGIPDHDSYVATYLKLVSALREDHPRAAIVLTEGAILSGERKEALREWLDEVARRSGDAHVRFVPSQHYPGDATDAHPTGEQHAAMARDLVGQVRPIMGW